MKRNLSFVISVFIVGILLVLLVPYFFKMFKKDNIMHIQYTKMIEMIEEDETFFLFISKEECPDCIELKNQLEKTTSQKHDLYIFEYAIDRPDTLISELQDIFPNFVFVPYVCHVNNGVIEEYSGEMNANKIYKWMDNLQDNGEEMNNNKLSIALKHIHS